MTESKSDSPSRILFILPLFYYGYFTLHSHRRLCMVGDLLLPAEGDRAAAAAGLERSDVGASDTALISV